MNTARENLPTGIISTSGICGDLKALHMALYLPEPFQSVIINTQLCFPGVIGQVEHLFYAFSLLVYVEAHFNLWVGARALFKKKKASHTSVS